MEVNYQVLKNWAEKIFKFLKEEKNLGAVTWLSTVFLTGSVAVLKFIRFVSESGKVAYWGISPTVINVIDDNILYDIIMTTMFAIVGIIIFLIPYLIIKSSISQKQKVIIILIIVIALSVLLFFGSNVRGLIKDNFWSGILSFLFADVFFILMFFAPTIVFLVSTKPSKDKLKPINKKGAIITVVVFVVFNILYFYIANYCSTKNETQYRITTDKYAIIYETDEVYYLAKYDEKENHILKEQQKIVSKENIEYIWTNVKIE